MRLLAVLVAAMFAFGAQAQNSCDDPFDGRNPSFPVSFWPLTDFCQRSVDLADIRSGGPPPDGIPPIDEPVFETIERAGEWLADQSPVIALAVGDEARAYPLAILMWHEIVNDVFDERPVAVTFCPLCNSSIVFDRTVNGEVLRFGVSGLLRASDMVMWDDKTQSFWQQFTGEGIVGAYTGTLLDVIPSQVVSFAAFRARYPQGVVLSRETGRSRDYGSNPYVGYDSSARPFLYGGDVDDTFPALAHVLGYVASSGAGIAYGLDVLRASGGAINHEFEGEPLLAVWQPGLASALDAAIIDRSRDMGMAALFSRELEGQILTFTAAEDGLTDAQTGSTWNVFGQAVAGPLAGAQLRLLPAGVHFWFAWQAFVPQTAVYAEG